MERGKRERKIKGGRERGRERKREEGIGREREKEERKEDGWAHNSHHVGSKTSSYK